MPEIAAFVAGLSVAVMWLLIGSAIDAAERDRVSELTEERLRREFP